MDRSLFFLEYGTQRIQYEVTFSQRKTLEIAVHPDSSVLVKAPHGTSLEKISSRVSKRARWVSKNIQYFAKFDPRTPPRAFVSGETHLYLGRQYRLKVNEGSQAGVKLAKGVFLVTCKDRAAPSLVKSLLYEWYQSKAREVFNNSLRECMQQLVKFDFSMPQLRIRQMERRWGSLSKKGILNLNIELIKAPRECIDYVITHELCHQKIYNHSPQYYDFLDQVMPDWATRKHRLELKLA